MQCNMWQQCTFKDYTENFPNSTDLFPVLKRHNITLSLTDWTERTCFCWNQIKILIRHSLLLLHMKFMEIKRQRNLYSGKVTLSRVFKLLLNYWKSMWCSLHWYKAQNKHGNLAKGNLPGFIWGIPCRTTCSLDNCHFIRLARQTFYLYFCFRQTHVKQNVFIAMKKNTYCWLCAYSFQTHLKRFAKLHGHKYILYPDFSP